MGIFDSLSGAASSKAAKNNIGVVGAGLTNATNALTQGYGAAGNLLGIRDGGNGLSSLNAGYGQARQDVTSQYGDTQGYLGGIQGAYNPLVQSGQQATDARADALGLNGADGSARASSAFQGSLGYNAGLDTGIDAVMRTGAARGNLAGGNTSRDLFNYGADYQNRQAGSYINNLGTVANNLNTGIAGQAAGLGLQGAASQQQGSALSGLGTGLGQNQATLYGLGSAQAAQQGLAESGLQTGAANALVQNNNNLAQSQNQASANLLDTLGGAFKGFSSGGGLSGLAGLFR